MQQQTIRLPHRLFSGIGIITVLFFSFCAVASWMSGQGGVSPFFLIFVALGLYVWLTAGETELNYLQIRHRTLLATHSIRWDDVVMIELDPQGQAVMYKGQDKRLVLPGIAAWPRHQRAAALALMDEQIKRYHIDMREGAWTAYKWSKNTREP